MAAPAAAAPRAARHPSAIPDEAQQAAAVARFERENAATRALARRVLATLDALVSAALPLLALLQSRSPAGVAAGLLAPLRDATSLRAVNAALLATAAVAAANAAVLWLGARRALPAVAALSLLPAAAVAAQVTAAGLWPRWGLWWLVATAPGLTWLSRELEATFDRIDAEIAQLVKLRFDVKSA